MGDAVPRPELHPDAAGGAAQPLSASRYAFVGFCGLALTILVAWYLTQRMEVLAAYGPQAYYFVLVLLGIAVAVFLFGVLRSTASLKGTQFGYAIDLGGPAVAAVLVVCGGFYFGLPAGEFSLTLFLRGEQPASELAKDAVIVVDIEGRRDRHPISAAGDVTIKGIPSRLRSSEISIGLESKLYRLKDPQITYLIPANAVIYMDVIPIGDEVNHSGSIPNLLYSTFKSIYEAAPDLQSVRGPAHLSADSYQAVYENAHVIWIKPLMTIFVLPKDPGRKLVRYQETSWATDSDLFDEEKARAIFQTPIGKHPPHGGIANLWRNDPEHWKWLGWLDWQCRFLDKIYYQQFENGVVLGTFRAHPTQDEGQIIAVLDNGGWRSVSQSDNVPKCQNVFEQFPK
ncbi:MAG TPA: hypothetical protein VGN55_20395 [Xanthobacteraceae bacterium]